MIEFWWVIWSAWAWWRYKSRTQTMPVLSREDSRELLNSLVDSGITDISTLEALGVRPCDIKEWKSEANKASQEMLQEDIQLRQKLIYKTNI